MAGGIASGLGSGLLNVADAMRFYYAAKQQEARDKKEDQRWEIANKRAQEGHESDLAHRLATLEMAKAGSAREERADVMGQLQTIGAGGAVAPEVAERARTSGFGPLLQEHTAPFPIEQSNADGQLRTLQPGQTHLTDVPYTPEQRMNRERFAAQQVAHSEDQRNWERQFAAQREDAAAAEQRAQAQLELSRQQLGLERRRLAQTGDRLTQMEQRALRADALRYLTIVSNSLKDNMDYLIASGPERLQIIQQQALAWGPAAVQALSVLSPKEIMDESNAIVNGGAQPTAPAAPVGAPGPRLGSGGGGYAPPGPQSQLNQGGGYDPARAGQLAQLRQAQAVNNALNKP